MFEATKVFGAFAVDDLGATRSQHIRRNDESGAHGQYQAAD
jgi:hypothetical protein